MNITFGIGTQDGASARVMKGITAEAHLLGKPTLGIFHTSLAWTQRVDFRVQQCYILWGLRVRILQSYGL